MKKGLYEAYEENRELIFSVLFYVSGLFIGTFIFKAAPSQVNGVFSELLLVMSRNITSLILSRLLIYYLMFFIIILFGLSVLGFSLINAVPLMIGISSALRICYYYSFSLRGVGCSLLTVIPETALIVSIIIFSVKNSARLSSGIYYLIKNSDTALDVSLWSYLKIVCVYAALVGLSAVINSLIIYAFSGIIKL